MPKQIEGKDKQPGLITRLFKNGAELLARRMHLRASKPEQSEGQDKQLRLITRLIRTGCKQSKLWITLIVSIVAYGKIVAYGNNVLAQLLPAYSLWLVMAASVGCGSSWLLARYKFLRQETCAAIFVFCLVTAILSCVLYFNQPGAAQPTISQHIAGVWGRDDCAKVTYRFSLIGNALTIESVKRPDGSSPYKFVGTIVGEKDTTMEVRGEEPVSAQGLAATFEYESNGKTQRLHWKDRVANGTDRGLKRCE